jgi:phage nucleotide-binding protein
MAKISTRSTKRSKPKQLPAVVRGIKKVEDLQENIVALIYGKSGRGKTKTAATFPGPVLFLDINNEKGLKTVRKVAGLKFAKIREWDDFIDLYWWLRDGQEFGSIVLDQITGLQDLCMRAVREHFRMDDDEPFQGFKKFGKLSGDMKTWLQNYRELSDLYNVVFIAHERAFDSEAEEGEIDPSVGARVMPSIGSFVEGACDVIGHCYIGATKEKNAKGKTIVIPEYRMRIGPHSIYTTKIRRPPDAGKIPEYIVDPSYQKLIAIESGKDLKNSTVKKEKRNGKKFKVR